MAKINLHPNIDRDVKKGVAWAVHAFTTCGIVLGFLALVAVLKNDPVAAFMWLGLALFVDGIDGTLARKARVLEYTPNFDGRTLDNVIDFFTYVAVPALMVYWFNMVPAPFWFPGQTWSLICAATIMAVSCYTFANVGMKSDDYYFVGFRRSGMSWCCISSCWTRAGPRISSHRLPVGADLHSHQVRAPRSASPTGARSPSR